MNQERRTFLDFTAMVLISTGVSLFSDSKTEPISLDEGSFLHGVASGDPLQDSLLIWTRITPRSESKTVNLKYEAALDKEFSHIVHSGNVKALAQNDYTVKVDLQGLKAGERYFYRFHSKNACSVTGTAKTLPKETDRINLAVFSCANYPSGYFNVYREALQHPGIDIAIHLGDYIYEYGMKSPQGAPAYGTKNAEKIGRSLPKGNDQELKTLNQYRQRYALYRSDPDLQALHAALPFICIWDDHEVVNDAYSSGSCHEESDVASYRQRKAAALRAYLEWLPIRTGQHKDQIFRSFHIGSLCSLHLLDTRHYARVKQLDYHDFFKEGVLDIDAFSDALNAQRALLGEKQYEWLESQMKLSKSRWNIIAQQVKVSPSLIPFEVISLATAYKNASPDQQTLLREQIVQRFETQTRIKARLSLKDPSLTSQERALVKQMLPYNLDAWDGYPKERERLLSLIESSKKGTLVLSGDAHYSWCSRLRTKEGKHVAMELGVTSVTSPGVEADYGLDDPKLLGALEESVRFLNSDTLYANYMDKGFLIVTITSEEVSAYWNYVDTIESRNFQRLSQRAKNLRMAYHNGTYRYRFM